MRRRITIPWPDPQRFPTMSVEVPVLLDGWFPPLTEDQILANTLAALDSRPHPFPDPNVITVVLERET